MGSNKTLKYAFTLVEVLVVIAIIGVLIALLLPAIQAAREAARRSQCVNNLKQIGLAVQNYHDAQRCFPSGRDGDKEFSISWAFSLLPYMEEDSIYQSRVPAQPTDAAVNSSAMGTPVAGFFCPSRRSPIADRTFVRHTTTPAVDDGAGGDYAANAGSQSSSYGIDSAAQPLPHIDPTIAGPMFSLSHISAKQVVDGLSKTIAAGEKYLPPAKAGYSPDEAEVDQGDTAFFSGDEAQTVMRSSKDGLASDKTDSSNEKFGSDHAGLSNFIMLDGHAAPIHNDIDVVTFQRLTSIGDGETISDSL
jgi:prepilin-type N-terminal cleavage/methylation domain-containing protein/prepilin-type processing-associated H-X9-DG protein